jgi:anti-sigma-K factor RskA
MDQEEFIILGSAYAVGALDGEELVRFESYLATASKQERELLDELQRTASLLSSSLSPTAPPARVKDEVMRRIAVSTRVREAVGRRTEDLLRQSQETGTRWIPWGIAAAVVMVALFSLFVLKLMDTIETQHRGLIAAAGENQRLQARLVELKDELTRKTEQLNVLAAKEIHVSLMSGLKVNPVGYGKIIWDAQKGVAILHVSNLPAVPSNKDYQLWVIKNNTPLSAGVFAVKDTLSNFFKIDSLAVTNPREIAAFAVTLEPKGGVPQPTGDMYMMGAPRL